MSTKEAQGAGSILGLSDITDNKSVWRVLVAEFIGTLLLVLLGCGSVILLSPQETSGLSPAYVVQIALAFGLTIGTLVQCIGHVSGCHINPAVTLSLFVTGDIKLLRALFYIIVQCLGAAAGSGLLLVMTPESQRATLGATDISIINVKQGLLMEAVLTFLLLLVIHSVCDPRRGEAKSVAPLSIGFCIVACHLCGVQFTGSSLNPARSFGPAVVMNNWNNHWIYWIGPIIGGVLAGTVYKFIFKVRKGEGDSYDL